jgi:hypothetical protein
MIFQFYMEKNIKEFSCSKNIRKKVAIFMYRRPIQYYVLYMALLISEMF